MTGTTATRTSHNHQPGRSDMDEHQRDEHLRTAYRAADQEWRAVNEAAHRPSPDDLDAACQRARDAALAALAGTGLNDDEALAIAERAARQQDDESEVPAGHAEHASRYPAQVGNITWHLLADSVTWAPAPAGCCLTLGRHGPRGEHDAYRGTGPTMQAGTPPGAPSPAPRPPPAVTSPPGWRPATPWPATCTPCPPCPASTASATTPQTLAGELGLILNGDLDPALADDSVLRMAEEAYFSAAGEAFWAEAERIAADRSVQHLTTSSQRGEA